MDEDRLKLAQIIEATLKESRASGDRVNVMEAVGLDHEEEGRLPDEVEPYISASGAQMIGITDGDGREFRLAVTDCEGLRP